MRYPSPNDLATTAPLSRLFGFKSWEAPRTLLLTARTLKKALTGEYNSSEVQWWRKWIFGSHSEDWYCDLFLPGASYKARGEITPAYSILNREDIARTKALNPEIRLIFFVRNPIERDWSTVRYCVDRGTLKADINSSQDIIRALEEMQAARAAGRVLRGEYERTLENYRQYFDASQILIGFYDAIARDPRGLMLGITEFLQVDAFEAAAVNNQTRINSSPALPIPVDVEDYLATTHPCSRS